MPKSLIRALEQLQSLREKLSTIILDETKSHSVLTSSPGTNALDKLLKYNQASLLSKASISVVIAPRKRHERVGHMEAIVKKVKKILISCAGTFSFSDNWDFMHQVSLISYYLNKRPLFFGNSEIMTPNTFECAMLRRSPQAPKVFTLSECIISSHKSTVNSIFEMKETSKQVLAQISAAMAITLLNQRSQSSS